MTAKDRTTAGLDLHRLMPYLADLELEVDRLRKHAQFLQHEVAVALKTIQGFCADPAAEPAAALVSVDQAAARLEALLNDVVESPGYHPSHDQVVAVAVRPLINRVFRRQQRLQGTPEVELRLALETENMEWFPARLHHILDNLIGNALTCHVPTQAASWVNVGLREVPPGYELTVSDNGVEMPAARRWEVLGLFHRSAPARLAGLGVGLAVVKLLVEQSGGKLTFDSTASQGTTLTAVLPRYELSDFLT